ncbi:MAG: membrane protein insertion efficiency factor YidD [Bdellovibrionota bacterium]|jgi:putative membrane protein insertion efficiency factor
MRKLLLKLIRLLHKGYKTFISPLFGDACRFNPSCSDYAVEAIEKYGLFKGSWLAIKRIIRCNPFCDGGDDPVP